MQTIKSVFVDDEAWFCVNDICKIYNLLQPSDAVKKIGEEQKKKIKIWFSFGKDSEGKNMGKTVEAWFVDTSGYIELRDQNPIVKRLQEISSEIEKLTLEREKLLEKMSMYSNFNCKEGEEA